MTIKKIDNYNNTNSVNPSYLMIDEMIGHFEEKNENKYLFWMMWLKTKKFQKNMKKFEVLKKKLKQIMVAKKLNMEKIT